MGLLVLMSNESAETATVPDVSGAHAPRSTTDTGKPASPAANSIPPPKEGIGRSSNFNPVKASDLLARPPEPLTWIWEPYLPVGSLALLAAYMKVGKSTFAYALAVAVAQGRPFLGYPTKQGSVLILAVEEHARDVRLRLERFGLSQNDPLYVHVGRLSWADMAEIRKFVKDQPVSLLILDTLSRFWDIKDENDNAEVTRRVSPFLDLAHETNVAVLLIHHERKSGGEDGRGIRGGSALFALVDQALLLDKRPGGDPSHRVLKAVGRYADSPAELLFELEGNQYRSLGTKEHLDFEEKKIRVHRVLTDMPRTPEAIAVDAELSVKTTNRVLEALCAENSGARAARQGKGVKGDPYLYCRPAMDSIPSQPLPIGKESNFAEPTMESPDKGNSIQVSTEERASRPSVEAEGPGE
jgi:AAA domain